ncbi:MAG: hypothetical protein DMD67_08220 [Gemmatimonadetes bacterium]|nr:MAG: hypothetical protein DMD67_08220 [Gemmatimonadota bacterium]
MILQNWWYTTLLGTDGVLQPPLRGHVQTDVAVVGAGMAGLSAAMRLMASGRRVTVLERNVCGGSSTGKSAGFLTPDSELELSQLMRRFGTEGARELWAVPVRGIELITGYVRRHDMQCDLVKQDSLFVGNSGSGRRDVQQEFEARRSLGFPQTLYPRGRVAAVLGTMNYTGGVRYPGTYGINALLYAQGIKRVLLANGVRVHESTEVRHIEGHTLHTHLGSVTADQIIVCADKLKPSFTPYARNVFHAQTFLSISEPLEERAVRRLFPEEPMQCWDTDLVYTYWRLTGDRRLLVGGGSALSTFALHAVTTPVGDREGHPALQGEVPLPQGPRVHPVLARPHRHDARPVPHGSPGRAGALGALRARLRRAAVGGVLRGFRRPARAGH